MKTLLLAFFCFFGIVAGAKADAQHFTPVAKTFTQTAQNACTANACGTANQACGATCRHDSSSSALALKNCYTFCCHDWVHCLAIHSCSTIDINCN
jgi:hypothetical protein